MRPAFLLAILTQESDLGKNVGTCNRAGDPPSLVADASRIRHDLGWKPAHDDLDEIVRTAYAWESRLNSAG